MRRLIEIAMSFHRNRESAMAHINLNGIAQQLRDEIWYSLIAAVRQSLPPETEIDTHEAYHRFVRNLRDRRDKWIWVSDRFIQVDGFRVDQAYFRDPVEREPDV